MKNKRYSLYDLCKSLDKGKRTVIVKKLKPHWSCAKKYILDKER